MAETLKDVTPPSPLFDEVDPESASDEVVSRIMSIEVQREAEGRTGGGPECPNCGARRLQPLPESRAYQCFECKVGVLVYVCVDGLAVRMVAR